MAFPSSGNYTTLAFGSNLDLRSTGSQQTSAPQQTSRGGGQGSSTRARKIADIKHQLLQPATTSHFICKFQPPPALNTWQGQKKSAGLAGEQYINVKADLIEMLCSEASLPGSTLATHDINNDYHGVTQKHAYRRLYDDRADFTFYVDTDYTPIRYFEGWMTFIVNEQTSGGLLSDNYYYRVNYPKGSNGYMASSIFVTKFEKNTSRPGATRPLEYVLLDAFPISMNSIPVSYDQSQILKVTVSFSFSRYVAKRGASSGDTSTPDPRNSGNPEFKITAEEMRQAYGRSEDFKNSIFGVDNSGKYDLNFDQPFRGNERATSYNGKTLGDFQLSDTSNLA